MSDNVLQHRGVVAVCFSCGGEKMQVFTRCNDCGAKPQQEDELLDSLILSRYNSSEIVLSRAVAERSPGLVIKSANRATMRSVGKALQDPQLRQLLGLEPSNKSASVHRTTSEQLLDGMMRSAKNELAGHAGAGLISDLEDDGKLSVWALNERLLQAVRRDAASASADVLLESVCMLAERCHAVEPSELQSHLQSLSHGKACDGDEQRRTWNAYQQSLVDRLVVSFERVKTVLLLDLFTRLEVTVERRRDKQVLPLIKALLDIYKLSGFEALQLESDNARRLMSALKSNSADEHVINQQMMSSLEALVGNWRALASPLSGVIADREVADIRREMQGALQDVAEHLASKTQEQELSARASRLALELL